MARRNPLFVDDAEIARLAVRQNEVFRRVKEGTIPAKETSAALQRLAEGRPPLYIQKLLPLTVNYQQVLSEIVSPLPQKTIYREHFIDNQYYVRRWREYAKQQQSYNSVAVLCTLDTAAIREGEDIDYLLERQGLVAASEVALLFLLSQHPYLLGAKQSYIVAPRTDFYNEHGDLGLWQTMRLNDQHHRVGPQSRYGSAWHKDTNFLALPEFPNNQWH